MPKSLRLLTASVFGFFLGNVLSLCFEESLHRTSQVELFLLPFVSLLLCGFLCFVLIMAIAYSVSYLNPTLQKENLVEQVSEFVYRDLVTSLGLSVSVIVTGQAILHMNLSVTLGMAAIWPTFGLLAGRFFKARKGENGDKTALN